MVDAYQLSSSSGTCAPQSIGLAVFTRAYNTAVTAQVIAGHWGMVSDVRQVAIVPARNATCWGNAACVAWDLAKVTRTSDNVHARPCRALTIPPRGPA
jgi:hypothetical protein